MRSVCRLANPMLLMVCMFAVLLCSCTSLTASGGGGTPTPVSTNVPPATPTPVSGAPSPTCASNATTTTEAWVTQGGEKPQVTGSINGGAETMLSNFVYPLGLPDEG